MPVKVYKGGILQIVSSPDSSSSFWNSCTTFGRRNYLAFIRFEKLNPTTVHSPPTDHTFHLPTGSSTNGAKQH